MKPYAEKLYTSQAWKDCRESYLLSQQFICERCGAIATIAHHKVWVTPRNINDPYITLSHDNLEALCQDCHNTEHHRNNTTQRYTFDADGNVIPPQ